MITNTLLELMTVAVDGELSPVEALRLHRELDACPEGRVVFAQLQADSNRLHALPRVSPPADLHQNVMAAVAEITPLWQGFTAPQSRPVAEPATVPFAQPRDPKAWRWVPAAVAASVLIGVAVSSFLFFRQGNEPNLVRSPKAPSPGNSEVAGNSGPKGTVPGTAVVVAPRPREAGNAVVGGSGNTPHLPEAVAIAPEPRTVRPDLHAAAPLPETRFDVVELRVPFLKPLADFDREDTRQQLAEELALDPAFKIDLFTRNPVRAVEQFRTAAKAAGIQIHADATTLTQIQRRNANAVVIYTESLSPAETAEFFGKLCAEDAKVSPRVFDMVHAVPVSGVEEKDLRHVLGTEPGLFKRPKVDADKRTKPGLDGKPISAGTADHIVKSITTGQGKDGEKPALLMTWSPLTSRTPPAASAELKSFLSKRGERKPNVVPVLIVIRPGN